MLPRLLVAAALLGFVLIAWLLFSGHPGAAGKLANWIYFVLITVAVVELGRRNAKES